MSGGSHYGHREIVQHFFRKNSSISFVALIWVADVGWIWTGDRRRELQCVVYTSATADPSLCPVPRMPVRRLRLGAAGRYSQRLRRR